MKRKTIPSISSKQKKLARKIHNWAYTDAQKHPKKFTKLFNEIWDSKLGKER